MATVRVVQDVYSTTINNNNDNNNNKISPISKLILESVSSTELEKVKRLLFHDNEEINENEDNEEEFVPLLSPQELGHYVESFIANNGKCILCENELRKFKQRNYPTYDIICKQGHLYQIKCSSGDNYFSLSNNKITIGDRKAHV